MTNKNVSGLVVRDAVSDGWGVPPLLYMAGRMTVQPDWRNEWRPKTLPDAGILDSDIPPVDVKVGRHKFRYTGPFGDDMSNHSFLHGNDGAMSSGEQTIFRRSLCSIQLADIVMARIDLPKIECHGTLAEIGYACGIGKAIYLMLVVDDLDTHHWNDIVVHRDPLEAGNHEAWFAIGMARRCITVSKFNVPAGVSLLADFAIADRVRVIQKR